MLAGKPPLYYNLNVTFIFKLLERGTPMLTKEEMPACPVATTVQLIGSKWKLLIMRNLLQRSWRFNELRKDLEGISQKYIDVHYIMEGAERIATADVSSLQIMTPFSEERDIGFYQGDESGRYLLKPGEFMVCFPSDAHKVAMMDKTPETVKKIVVKIRV